jgi:hypothetical protein
MVRMAHTDNKEIHVSTEKLLPPWNFFLKMALLWELFSLKNALPLDRLPSAV